MEDRRPGPIRASGVSATLATLATVVASARAEGGGQRQSLRKINTVTVEVPEAAAGAFTARMRARRDVENVELIHRRSMSLVPDDPGCRRRRRT